MQNTDKTVKSREQELSDIRHTIGNNMSVIKSATQIIKMRNPDAAKDPMWEKIELNVDDVLHFLDELKNNH